MCGACSPFCGRCITPMLKAVKCSHCNEDNVLTRNECIVSLGYRRAEKVKEDLKHGGEHPLCEKCGSDLSEDIAKLIVPLDCIYMEVVCGYPCGRHSKVRKVGDPMCMKQMPLRKLEVA